MSHLGEALVGTVEETGYPIQWFGPARDQPTEGRPWVAIECGTKTLVRVVAASDGTQTAYHAEYAAGDDAMGDPMWRPIIAEAPLHGVVTVLLQQICKREGAMP